MTEIILFVLTMYCGNGCYELTARKYENLADCKRHEINTDIVIARCVVRKVI